MFNGQSGNEKLVHEPETKSDHSPTLTPGHKTEIPGVEFIPVVSHDTHLGVKDLNGTSLPASTTSLPVAGVAIAPIHGRRRRKYPRRVESPEPLDAPGPPRRANSMPVGPAPLERENSQNQQGATRRGMDWDKLLQPTKKLKAEPTIKQSMWNTLTYSYINLMLLLIPVAWGMNYSKQDDTLVFTFSFLSIIPLAALLGFSTEELALRVGPALGGLLNATFGNAVELIIAILALVKNEIKVVQASMLGSILSNCLLVLGMCFLAGGMRFHEQGYGVRIAQQQISLLSLSVFSVVVPAAFTVSVAVVDQREILAISHATAIILLICYAAYLLFQLWTHSYLYTAEASRHHAQATFLAADEGIQPPRGQSVFRVSSIFTHSSSSDDEEAMANGRPASTTTSSSSSSASTDWNAEEEPKLTKWFAVGLLVIITVITGLTAEFMVGSIAGLTDNNAISREFVALILLPMVGNAAEHVTAVTVSVRNKLDLAMTVAVGSSIQIALFVLPLLVVLGWIMGRPLTLNFDVYETIIVFLAVIIVNYAIADGRTNWLEGFVLMVIYVIIAVSAWYYEGDPSNTISNAIRNETVSDLVIKLKAGT